MCFLVEIVFFVFFYLQNPVFVSFAAQCLPGGPQGWSNSRSKSTIGPCGLCCLAAHWKCGRWLWLHIGVPWNTAEAVLEVPRSVTGLWPLVFCVAQYFLTCAWLFYFARQMSQVSLAACRSKSVLPKAFPKVSQGVRVMPRVSCHACRIRSVVSKVLHQESLTTTSLCGVILGWLKSV